MKSKMLTLSSINFVQLGLMSWVKGATVELFQDCIEYYLNFFILMKDICEPHPYLEKH